MTGRERRRRAACLGLAAALAALALPVPAAAQSSPRSGDSRPASASQVGVPEGETPPEAAAQAREHFKKARELYQAGSYREAITELEAARALDPRAKDLVFNLGVVNEKLGEIDQALKYFRLYATMDLDPQERARGDAYIKRLEGAKREVAARTGGKEPPPPPPPPPGPAEPPSKGRIDAATVVAASVAVVGLGLGAVFGIKALSDQPSNFVAGKSGSVSDYQRLRDDAHKEAVIADVALGVGLAATVVTAYLYFARPKVQSSSQTGRATVSAAPTVGGGAIVVIGSF